MIQGDGTCPGGAQGELAQAQSRVKEQELEIEQLRAKIRGLQSGQQELEIQQLRANIAVLQSTRPADNSPQVAGRLCAMACCEQPKFDGISIAIRPSYHMP